MKLFSMNFWKFISSRVELKGDLSMSLVMMIFGWWKIVQWVECLRVCQLNSVFVSINRLVIRKMLCILNWLLMNFLIIGLIIWLVNCVDSDQFIVELMNCFGMLWWIIVVMYGSRLLSVMFIRKCRVMSCYFVYMKVWGISRMVVMFSVVIMMMLQLIWLVILFRQVVEMMFLSVVVDMVRFVIDVICFEFLSSVLIQMVIIGLIDMLVIISSRFVVSMVRIIVLLGIFD